jgi:hypothetical protein
MADIGLSSLVSLTFTESLPKTTIIREFEDNIRKYASEEISSEDVLRIATRITNKQLKDIEKLNELADKDQEAFVKRLEEEAHKQTELEKERRESLKDIIETFKKEIEKVDEIKKADEEKNKRLEFAENELASKNRLLKIMEVKKWQRKGWWPFSIVTIVILIFASWCFYKTGKDTLKICFAKDEFKFIIIPIVSLVWGCTHKILYDRFLNHSNIENFKKSLEDK